MRRLIIVCALAAFGCSSCARQRHGSGTHTQPVATGEPSVDARQAPTDSPTTGPTSGISSIRTTGISPIATVQPVNVVLPDYLQLPARPRGTLNAAAYHVYTAALTKRFDQGLHKLRKTNQQLIDSCANTKEIASDSTLLGELLDKDHKSNDESILECDQLTLFGDRITLQLNSIAITPEVGQLHALYQESIPDLVTAIRRLRVELGGLQINLMAVDDGANDGDKAGVASGLEQNDGILERIRNGQGEVDSSAATVRSAVRSAAP